MLVVTASPYPGLGMVSLQPEASPPGGPSLHELLNDLSINNTRLSYLLDDASRSMAMCSFNNTTNTYNHDTGWWVPNGAKVHIIDPDGPDAVPLDFHQFMLFSHKGQLCPWPLKKSY